MAGPVLEEVLAEARRLQQAHAMLSRCGCRAASELGAEIGEALAIVDGVVRGYHRVTSIESLRNYVRELLEDAIGVLEACGCRS